MIKLGQRFWTQYISVSMGKDKGKRAEITT